MNPTRVLICHCDSLLGLGIESIFSDYGEIMIESCSPKNEQEYFTLVDRFQPEVVILGECSPLASDPQLSNILQRAPQLRVIVASREDNWLHIYQKQDVLLKDASDLIEFIQSS